VTVYTWEGNAANISCEVLAHPGASVVWFRDGQQLSSTNTTNVKIYNTPAVSYLEVWYNRDMRAPKTNETPLQNPDISAFNDSVTSLLKA
jgi:hypothetical protein